MADQWPPNVPGVNKAFKKAHDATNDNIPRKDASEMVSKKQIRELESQRRKPMPQLNMIPMAKKQDTTADQERENRIQKMKKRLQEVKGKARDDFDRSK